MSKIPILSVKKSFKCTCVSCLSVKKSQKNCVLLQNSRKIASKIPIIKENKSTRTSFYKRIFKSLILLIPLFLILLKRHHLYSHFRKLIKIT